MNTQSIEQKIIGTLADLLEKPAIEISPNMTLFGALGLESVEMLELSFLLEQDFGIQLDANDLWKIPDFILSNELYKNGKFADEAINLIKQKIQHISEKDIEEIKSPHNILKFLTVKDLIDYVAEKKS